MKNANWKMIFGTTLKMRCLTEQLLRPEWHRHTGRSLEMFTNLIESDSHRRDFKRRSSFFLATTVTYALILFGAGIGSIYAYDARLEAQSTSLELLNWVPPVATAPARPHETRPAIVRRTTPSDAPVDPHITRPERTEFVSRPDDPNHVPDNIGTKGTTVPPIVPGAVLTGRNLNPPPIDTGNSGCLTCNGNGSAPVVKLDDEKPPPPTPVKPQTQKLPSYVLASKAVSLPQPPYPPMARQIHLQGQVNVQILVDEQGKVISAQAVSGNSMLTSAARDAALRARFTPTILSGQPVKVQGVITYNFVLQ
jgi:TonB family protein